MNPLAILHTESSLGWGGQEIRILTEARGMLDRGHRVTLLTPAEAEISPAAKRAGVPVEAVAIAAKRLGPLFALRGWLARHGKEYDILNTHSSTDSWLSAVACATLTDMPALVRTRHVSTPVNNHFSTRWLYDKATAHIVTTGEAPSAAIASRQRLRAGADDFCAYRHRARLLSATEQTRNACQARPRGPTHHRHPRHLARLEGP